ncbi:Putative L-aspartate dehydrogenase [Toxocara canis]|uniref:Aspartate dehydrogenase domain-containing protein n=1 Tax=Toxocara canis TaxID=6265 RepID=A0A0B2V657_TOXCA|nr:Putative L-aspartate dehydrogenase [Toxocara canis]
MTVKIGLIGYGHLGKFLKEQLEKDERFTVTKIWNRTVGPGSSILPLSSLDAENISSVDLVIEVAHASIIANFGVLILKYADLFVGSPTALADNVLYEALKKSVNDYNRRLFVPCGAFWGSNDVQKMANLGTLKGLTITMIRHPSSLRLEGPLKELSEKAKLSDSAVVLYDEVGEGEKVVPQPLKQVGSPTALADNVLYEALKKSVNDYNRRLFVPCGAFWGSNDVQKMANLGTLKGLTITMIRHPSSLRLEGPLKELSEKAKLSDSAVVLYDGPVRALCSLAPSNVNTMAAAALAAHTLGFDLTRAKLISDPSLLRWHIVEIDVEGPDGFHTRTRRENPAKPGAVIGNSTYHSFLASVQGIRNRELIPHNLIKILLRIFFSE